MCTHICACIHPICCVSLENLKTGLPALAGLGTDGAICFFLCSLDGIQWLSSKSFVLCWIVPSVVLGLETADAG